MEMKGINNIRIDDRLIHGQVATMWSNKLGVTRLMVVNDEVANNDIQKQVLRMAVPAGIASSIITTQTALNNIKADKYAGQNVLLIVKSPVDLLPFVEAGLELKTVNVGNMSNRKETTVLRPNISVSKEERAAFEKLLADGVEITTVMTPDDKKTFLKDILEWGEKLKHQVILMSHGSMAKETLNSAKMILGDALDYPVVSMQADDGIEGTLAKLEEILQAIPEKQPIVIIADLLWGTPANVAVLKANSDPRIKVVTGLNLGMVLESFFALEDPEIVTRLLDAGAKAVTQPQLENDEEE